MEDNSGRRTTDRVLEPESVTARIFNSNIVHCDEFLAKVLTANETGDLDFIHSIRSIVWNMAPCCNVIAAAAHMAHLSSMYRTLASVTTVTGKFSGAHAITAAKVWTRSICKVAYQYKSPDIYELLILNTAYGWNTSCRYLVRVFHDKGEYGKIVDLTNQSFMQMRGYLKASDLELVADSYAKCGYDNIAEELDNHIRIIARKRKEEEPEDQPEIKKQKCGEKV